MDITFVLVATATDPVAVPIEAWKKVDAAEVIAVVVELLAVSMYASASMDNQWCFAAR